MFCTIERDATFGYAVRCNGLSQADEITLSSDAIDSANELFLSHLELAYRLPILSDSGVNIWWTIFPTDRFDQLKSTNYLYFSCALLRSILEKGAREVVFACELPELVRSALEEVCDEASVKYRNDFDDPAPERSKISHCLLGYRRLAGQLARLLAGLQRRANRAVLRAVAPLVRYWYSRRLKNVEVVFLLFERKPHLRRYGSTPNDLVKKGHTVGYVSSGLDLSGNPIRLMARTLSPGSPVYTDWYALGAGMRSLERQAHRMKEALGRVVRSNWNTMAGPEFGFFKAQVLGVSVNHIASRLAEYEGHENAASQCSRGVWLHARPLSNTARLITAAVRRSGHKMISVAPHVYTPTRLSNRFLDREFLEPYEISFPDLLAVQYPWSREILTRGRACQREVRVIDPGRHSGSGSPVNLSKSPTVLPKSSKTKVVLVLLQTTPENPEILRSIVSAVGGLENAHFIFKPHPSHPVKEGLGPYVEGQAISCEMTEPDAPLDELIARCGICVSTHSTAALPALAAGIPVVWAQHASRNFVVLKDLQAMVGLTACDPETLRGILCKLLDDEEFYGRESEKARTGAEQLGLTLNYGRFDRLADVVVEVLNRI